MFRSTPKVRIAAKQAKSRLAPAYRYADRTISSTRWKPSVAWRVVSEDSLTSNNSMIESSEYFRLIAPPSFIDGVVSIDFVVPDTVCPGPHRSALQVIHEQGQNDLVSLGHIEQRDTFQGIA